MAGYGAAMYIAMENEVEVDHCTRNGSRPIPAPLVECAIWFAAADEMNVRCPHTMGPRDVLAFGSVVVAASGDLVAFHGAG